MIRKKFFQIANLVIMSIFMLLTVTGCGGNDANSQLIGTWYSEDMEDTGFEFHEDGTVNGLKYKSGKWQIIENGKWKLSKDKQLQLYNADDGSEKMTVTITEISDETMIWNLEEYDMNLTFIKAEDETKMAENIALEDNKVSKNILEDYQLEKFMQYDISSSGEFWAYAADDYENSVYVAIGDDNLPMYTLNTEEYSLKSGIYDGLSLVMNREQENYILLNGNGQDVSDKYADINNGEKIIAMAEDITGVTIWTIQDTDTYDKHIRTLNAKDISGNVKMSWNSENDKELYLDDMEAIEFIANGTYTSDQRVINVKTGNYFEYPPSGNHYGTNGADEEGCVYAGHNTGSAYTLTRFSDKGEIVWEVNGLHGTFSEGVLFQKTTSFNGFIDKDGNHVINLSLNVPPEGPFPRFLNGYAVVECENETRVKFVTVIDKNGTMLLEPVKGQAVYKNGGQFGAVLSDIIPAAEIDKKYVMFDHEGNMHEAPSYWYQPTDQCKIKGENYLTIENGSIVEYDIDIP